MSRCNDCDEEPYPNAAALFTANLRRLIAGKNGQRWLREIEAALLALPTQRLIDDYICKDGDVCLVGAVAAYRLGQGQVLTGGLGFTGTSVENRQPVTVGTLAELQAATEYLDADYETAYFARHALGMAKTLAYELVWQNDEGAPINPTPEQRWQYCLDWVRRQIIHEAVTI